MKNKPVIIRLFIILVSNKNNYWKSVKLLRTLFYSAGIFFIGSILILSQSIQREVAITIDDLPTVTLINDIKSQQSITKDLLHKLNKYNVPAIGFVNEGTLYENDILIKERLDLLKQWINSGFDLGNHTFSHRSLNQIPVEEYLGDILKGEQETRKLMKDAGKELRYFRHPFLHTGRDSAARESVNKFFKEHNYTIAPVTIDNSDWVFARAYDNALVENDSSMMNKIVEEYISYMDKKFEHFEVVSNKLFGREIKQVLLIHAKKINTDHFEKLAEMMTGRGYKFISLKETLEDKAYESPDSFLGAGGISWLHRWTLTEQIDKSIFKGDLPTPDYILKYAGIESE